MVRSGINLEPVRFLADAKIGVQAFIGPAGILDPGDVAMSGQNLCSFGFNVVLGARGDIIKINRC